MTARKGQKADQRAQFEHELSSGAVLDKIHAFLHAIMSTLGGRKSQIFISKISKLRLLEVKVIFPGVTC